MLTRSLVCILLRTVAAFNVVGKSALLFTLSCTVGRMYREALEHGVQAHTLPDLLAVKKG